MISIDIDEVRFTFRAGGLSVRDGKVLLNRGIGEDYWFIPGGRVEGGEDSAMALRREMREELGEEIVIRGSPFTIENFFTVKGRRFHEIGLYYWMEAGKTVTGKRIIEDGGKIEYAWLPLAELPGAEIRPRIMKDILLNNSADGHYLVREY